MTVTLERKGNMQVTIELPDDIGQKFQSLQKKQSLQDALTTHISQIIEEEEQKADDSQMTQVERILKSREDNNVDLNGYSSQISKDSREFRDHFSFKHDQ